MLVNMNQLLPAAAASSYAVPCFNIFGYETGLAVVEAAEALDVGVILACNKDMAEYMGINAVAAMFRRLGEQSSVPVVAHLDHTYEESIIYRAIGAGFTSVMFDGSQLPLEENISRTAAVVDVAHQFDVTAEGEIGSIPYTTGRDHIKAELTKVDEAQRFAAETKLDCVAISIGNIHRLTTPGCDIDYQLLDRLSEVIPVPLVIHGTSGIFPDDIRKLASTRVAKFNIGTALRQTHGHNLRALFNEHPEEFDQLFYMKKLRPYIKDEVLRQFELVGVTG